MSRRAKGTALAGAALLVVALTIGSIFMGSVIAANMGVGESTDVFRLSVGSGTGQVGYVESNGDVDAWGPWSFTVLSNGNVAILDAANKRLLVVDESGREVQSLAYQDLGLVSPCDLCEWHGHLAVTESNTAPQSIVLVNLQSGRSESATELPAGLAETSLLSKTNDGGLQLVVGMTEEHVVANADVVFDLATIKAAHPAPDVCGVGKVEVDTKDSSNGPALRVTRASDNTSKVRHVSADGIPAARVDPVGASQGGNLLAKTAYFVTAGGITKVKFYIEELSRDTLETVSSVSVPYDEFYVWPARDTTVDNKGRVWCMVPEKDKVVFRILTPRSGKPDVNSGAMAAGLTAIASKVGNALRNIAKPDQAVADSNPPARQNPWQRNQGYSWAMTYYAAYWYCSSEAYGRSCGTVGGPYDNTRPHFITSYNCFYTFYPYAWGHWNWPTDLDNHVNQPGHDAGDASGGTYSNGDPYPTLPCVYGTDCSGLVSRVWGLWVNDSSQKHGTSNLAEHATMLSDSLPMTYMQNMDVFLHEGHVILFDYLMADGDTAVCFESTTQNNWDSVRHSTQKWSVLRANAKPYHRYYYNYWTP